MISANRLRSIRSIERIDPFSESGPIFKRSVPDDDPDAEGEWPEPGTPEFFETCMRGLLESMRQGRELIKAADEMGQQQLDELAEHLGIDRASR
jgi:hypothetical protein